MYTALSERQQNIHTRGGGWGGGSASAKPDSVVMKEAANAKRSPPSAGFLPLNQNWLQLLQLQKNVPNLPLISIQ